MRVDVLIFCVDHLGDSTEGGKNKFQNKAND